MSASQLHGWTKSSIHACQSDQSYEISTTSLMVHSCAYYIHRVVSRGSIMYEYQQPNEVINRRVWAHTMKRSADEKVPAEKSKAGLSWLDS